MNSVPPAGEQGERPRLEVANLQPVSTSSRSSVALIIDHDLGFLLWLGEVFAELGCQAIPALHCRQALALTNRLKLSIKTVVVDPELAGAARMVKALTAANPDARVVVIRNAAADPSVTPRGASANGIRARSVLERPLPWEPVSRPEWVAKVRKALA